MSVTINSENINELKKYLPIKLGWLKFFGGVIGFILIEFGIYCLCKHFISLLPLASETAGLGLLSNEFAYGVAAFFLACAGAIFFGVVVFSEWTKKWVDSYYVRNIRGYIARFWIEDATGSTWHCVILTPVENRIATEPNQKALGGKEIVLQLGGWVSHFTTGVLNHRFPVMEEWKIRLHKITYTVFVELRHRSALDDKDDCVIIQIDEAIRLLRKSYRQRGALGFSQMLAWLYDGTEELDKQVEVLKKILGNFEETNSNLIALLETIEERIEKSTRLRETIEGREILVLVLNCLAQQINVQPDHPQLGFVRARIDNAQAALAQARKRSKHRKVRENA